MAITTRGSGHTGRSTIGPWHLRPVARNPSRWSNRKSCSRVSIALVQEIGQLGGDDNQMIRNSWVSFCRELLALCVMWSFSAGAAVLKSVQTGTTPMNPAVQSVPITAVNTATTFVICQNDTGGTGSNATTLATCELNSAITLTITTNVADAALTVRWYVVEFLSGVSVQRGLTPLAGGTLTAAPPALNPAVNLAHSFVLITQNISTASQTIDERWTARAQLTTTTNLQLTRNQGGSTVNVAWQVIQINAAAVQSGIISIGQAATVSTVVLPAAVDTTRTFLVFSRSAGTNSGGAETYYQTTGEITNGTTLTFTRAFQDNTAGTQVDIVWYVVRMTDGTTVQRNLCGPSGTGGGSDTMPAAPAGCLTIPTAITTSRSAPFISVRDDPASGTPTADLDDTSWRAALAPTSITLNRSTGSSLTSNAWVAWQVVQFANAPNIIDRREIFP